MKKSLKIKRRDRPRASIGDQYYYVNFGPRDNVLTIISESPTPGFKGYYDYFCRVDLPNGKVTHSVIHGQSLFAENSIYVKMD
ncbi:hypothetical protein D1872_178430 [compost metagenome]